MKMFLPWLLKVVLGPFALVAYFLGELMQPKGDLKKLAKEWLDSVLPKFCRPTNTIE